jgi:CRISPR/Cas system-associated exonuclease Cas4 (RecB family)
MTTINKRYPYFTLERETQPTGERMYMTPDGPLPSVTTILSATADTSGLDAWRAYVGETKANQIRDEATGLGTLMHEHLECHIQEIDRPRGSNIVRQMAKNMADTIINRGLIHVDEVWGFEIPLYYPGLYAGTADLLGQWNGQQAVLDYKTTNKMKTKEQLTDYACQLSAYAMAHNELFGTEINTGVIFMVSRDLKFEEYVFDVDEMKAKTQEWLGRVEKYFAMQQTS